MKLKYSIFIQWSEADQLYIASLPEFPVMAIHGETYAGALKEAEEILNSLIAEPSGDHEMPAPMTTERFDVWEALSPKRGSQSGGLRDAV